MSFDHRITTLTWSLAIVVSLVVAPASLLSAQETPSDQQGQSGDPASAVVPLVAPAQGQRLLAIVTDGERTYLREACRQLDVATEFVDDFDVRRRDYRGFHAIIVGSNKMDYFAKEEYQAPAVFQPVVDFVAAGGHLIMFATYHGRNMEHVQRFGISAFSGGANGFAPTPGTTEVLFAGSEAYVPQDRSLTFIGRTDISRPHVVMLNRQNGEAAVSTVPYGSGRVTIAMVEPSFRNDNWLFRVVLAWHIRGGPSRQTTSGFVGIPWNGDADQRSPLPDAKDLTSLTAAIQQEFGEEYQRLRPWNPTMAKEVARTILAQADTAEDPARRFAILSEARTLAVKSGNAAMLFNVIEQCGRQYQTDPLSELVDSLDECASECRTTGDSRTLAFVGMLGTSTAIEREEFELADELLEIASRSARRSRLPGLISDVAEMRRTVAAAQRE